MRRLSVVLALGMLLATAGSALAVDFTLKPGRDFTGQTGKVSITVAGDQLKVVIDAIPGPAGATTPQPAHVHEGSCPGVGAVVIPLTNVVNGKSETTIPLASALGKMTPGKAYSINLHRSATEGGVYTACTELEPAAIATLFPATALPKTGGLPFNADAIAAVAALFAAAGVMLRRR